MITSILPGHISRVDVVKVISAFGQTMSEKELDLLIADLDLNGTPPPICRMTFN